MKTKQIKGAADILLVGEAPEGVNYLIHNKESTRTALIVYTDVINSYPVVLPANLPLGEDWQFHCRLSEMTEEQAAAMVKTCMNVGWFDYRNKDNGTCRGLDTAKESFQSLLEANGVLKENPHEKPNEGNFKYWDGDNAEYFEDDMKTWQEAEYNVFPPETTLVFIKQ